MKKSILAATVAASVAVAPVAVPQAWAADEADEPAAEPAASAGTSSEESLSPAAIAGITLGVLALVSAGTALAVQQGWIQIPGVDMAQINALFPALPTLPALPGRANNRAAATPAKGSCAPEEFDKLVPGWPNFTGTTVTYCDGLWATAGANQTDWTETFRFTGGAWQRVPKRGTTYTGFGCYNGLTLREQGAPQQLIDAVLICKPNEID
ncbi:hypothetical protein V6D40_08530 [Corynebacterium sp. Q4381]|uniref:hypothetical protein n=1 Tax=Corynebacterium sp. Marseille-Q4381 TaxID=3121597 RepID=UPI002FE666F4